MSSPLDNAVPARRLATYQFSLPFLHYFKKAGADS
jgi:hypothetical protein